jgi:hypothetical protein
VSPILRPRLALISNLGVAAKDSSTGHIGFGVRTRIPKSAVIIQVIRLGFETHSPCDVGIVLLTMKRFVFTLLIIYFLFLIPDLVGRAGRGRRRRHRTSADPDTWARAVHDTAYPSRRTGRTRQSRICSKQKGIC